jgi:hypothetical protein
VACGRFGRLIRLEEGFSLARGGFYGENIAVDYHGRVWAAANHYTAGDRTIVAHLPAKGTRTVYARLGDFFPWSCIAGLAGFVAVALMQDAGRQPVRPGSSDRAREDAAIAPAYLLSTQSWIGAHADARRIIDEDRVGDAIK